MFRLSRHDQTYFGQDGVFCDGPFTNWLSMNVYLMSASVDERPPRSLLFIFEHVVPNPTREISSSRSVKAS